MRGFTLIEMLAVIVIVSMVAAIGSIGLVSGSQQARLHAAVMAWCDLDSQARLHAQAGSSVRMIVRDDNSAVLISSWPNQEELSRLALPDGHASHLYIGDRTTKLLVFDAQGRSDDYRVELRLRDSNELKTQWQVCGLTGWIVRDEVLP